MAKYFKRGGSRWEKDLQEEGVGKRQPLSGAGWGAKNDLRNKKMHIEAKHTEAEKTYTLKKLDLKLVVRNAAVTGRVGCMMLDFSGDEYVIMRRQDWEQCIISGNSKQIIDGGEDGADGTGAAAISDGNEDLQRE